MNSRHRFAISPVPRPPAPADCNLPGRAPAGRRAPLRIANNSPVPVRTRGTDPLLENLPIASAAATRTAPRRPYRTRRADDLRRRFQELADRWREETGFHSAISMLYLHPAYQEIIGLGPEALPLLLEDLAQTRSDWFWALRAISGENPVPAEERGMIDRMTDRWLEWGHQRGLL